MVLSKESANLRLLPLKPRLIEIQKGENGYGFYLRMKKNTGGKNQVKHTDHDSHCTVSSWTGFADLILFGLSLAI